MTATPTSEPPTRPTTPRGVVDLLPVILVIGTGAVAWAVGIRTRAYDYDEVMHAHAVWLASRGLRPYTDFLACHPPYFALVAPVMRYYPDPCDALQALRVTGAVGYLAFLGGLTALATSAVTHGRRWAVLGVAVVAAHPTVLEYLVEFRIDGWGYALATWGLYRFRHAGRGFYRYWEVGLLSACATLLCPKLALLTPLIVLAGFCADPAVPAVVLRSGVSYLGGLATAAVLIALSLSGNRIEIGRAYDLVIRFYAISNAHSAFRHGLLTRLVEHWDLSALAVVGLTGWAVGLVRRQARPGAIEAGVVAWLALHVLLVAYPHKQYYAPWYLFASILLAFPGRGLAGLPRVCRTAIVWVAVGLTVLGASRQAWRWSQLDDVRAQNGLIRWMDAVAAPGDRVVASPPTHPIDRRDSFFVWLITSDPAGFDSERILARLPAYRWSVTATEFRKELAANPPAFVLLGSPWGLVPYTPGQTAALNEFLPRHGYRFVRHRGAGFAVRPDRFDFARREHLVE